MENKPVFKVKPATKPKNLYSDHFIKTHNTILCIFTWLGVISILVFYIVIIYCKIKIK